MYRQYGHAMIKYRARHQSAFHRGVARARAAQLAVISASKACSIIDARENRKRAITLKNREMKAILPRPAARRNENEAKVSLWSKAKISYPAAPVSIIYRHISSPKYRRINANRPHPPPVSTITPINRKASRYMPTNGDSTETSCLKSSTGNTKYRIYA